MKIFAAMVEFDSGAAFAGVDAAGYDSFDNCLGRADAMFQEHCRDPNAIKMFVAPEYYFSGHNVNNNGSLNINSLSRSDKHKLYEKIKQSSARYPDILIVPGSIAYSKARGFSKRKYYNVCPIAAGGNIIHKYYKQSNDTFQTDDDFKSKNYGSTFNYGSLTFGIDICLDHGQKKLKNSLNGGRVDVHILISDGSAPSPNSLATDQQGLVVFCDMNGGRDVMVKGENVRLNGIKNVTLDPQYKTPRVSGKNVIASSAQALAGSGKVSLYSGEV